MQDLIIFRYSDLIWTGLNVTIRISILSMLAGVIFGLIIALIKGSKNTILSSIGYIFTELARNTPALVGIMWFTYVFPQLFSIKIPVFWTAWMALTFQTSGYMAEVFRAGIEAIGKEQRYAAKSVGLTFYQEMKLVILPQAIRIMIPDILNQFVVVFKTSTLVSVVAVRDLMYQAHRLSSQLYQPVEIYTSVAIIYILIIFILSILVNIIQKKYKVPGY